LMQGQAGSAFKRRSHLISFFLPIWEMLLREPCGRTWFSGAFWLGIKKPGGISARQFDGLEAESLS
jgi:hypothetical protein